LNGSKSAIDRSLSLRQQLIARYWRNIANLVQRSEEFLAISPLCPFLNEVALGHTHTDSLSESKANKTPQRDSLLFGQLAG
jgi:hypothetical protein